MKKSNRISKLKTIGKIAFGLLALTGSISLTAFSPLAGIAAIGGIATVAKKIWNIASFLDIGKSILQSGMHLLKGETPVENPKPLETRNIVTEATEQKNQTIIKSPEKILLTNHQYRPLFGQTVDPEKVNPNLDLSAVLKSVPSAPAA